MNDVIVVVNGINSNGHAAVAAAAAVDCGILFMAFWSIQ